MQWIGHLDVVDCDEIGMMNKISHHGRSRDIGVWINFRLMNGLVHTNVVQWRVYHTL